MEGHLGDVEVHAARLDDLRRGRVIVIQHLCNDAFIDHDQRAWLADPLLLLRGRLRWVRVQGHQVQQTALILRQTLQ